MGEETESSALLVVNRRTVFILTVFDSHYFVVKPVCSLSTVTAVGFTAGSDYSAAIAGLYEWVLISP